MPLKLPVTEESLAAYITTTFRDVQMITHDAGGQFFFHSPGGIQSSAQKMPFATVIDSDAYDDASNLSRPGIFRLNLGLRKETYRTLLGEQPSFPTDGGYVRTRHDFTELDVLIPHPVYASASWVCILNPGKKTRDTVIRLLAEAYELATERVR